MNIQQRTAAATASTARSTASHCENDSGIGPGAICGVVQQKVGQLSDDFSSRVEERKQILRPESEEETADRNRRQQHLKCRPTDMY